MDNLQIVFNFKLILFSANDDDVKVVGGEEIADYNRIEDVAKNTEEVVSKDGIETPTTEGGERKTTSTSSGGGITKDYLIEYCSLYDNFASNHKL